ncbi:carbohydrate ABC transporter permease [Xylocopilactobacillus apicola]|uniref:Sugar ABC transporter permease n=1 Tax=Xylocopilactobacillus apicola TaxID=2932184 RepID=A0AAU9D476_9LACO|nr:sugar ABC transporter permease [Xylocopilactobacillus apicola]BDR59661.1 sugar ABC transporter permease [Xylocopilactobacillus apicola]
MINQKTTWKQTLHALLYLAPMMILLTIFFLYPILSTFVMSIFKNYDFYRNVGTGVSLTNFIYLSKDPLFHRAVINTFVFVLGVVPASVIISLGISLLLNRFKKVRSLFQTIYFLPYVTSTVAIAMVWVWIYHSDYGVLNFILGLFHTKPIGWLNDPHYTLLTLIIFSIWKNLGLNIILFLVALNSVPRQYYLSASLDGASTWQQFTNITLPLISPTTFLVTINAMIASFKVFDQIYVFYHNTAGPNNSGMTIVYYLYQKFYTENNYPVASAAGVVLFVIIIIATVLQNYVSRHYVHY